MLNLNKYKELIFPLKYILIFFELFLLLKYLNIITNKTTSISNYFLKNNSKAIIKRTLQEIIYKNFKINITFINSLFIKDHLRFGNYYISLNNAIIFCEFLRCKTIIIENKNEFINDKIVYKKYKLTIIPKHSFNNIDNNSMIVNARFFLYNLNFTNLGKVNRFYIFRKEIINNLPKVKINSDELYIYIRGGDIFRHFNKSCPHYTQPPLCFYKCILNKLIS